MGRGWIVFVCGGIRLGYSLSGVWVQGILMPGRGVRTKLGRLLMVHRGECAVALMMEAGHFGNLVQLNYGHCMEANTDSTAKDLYRSRNEHLYLAYVLTFKV